MSKEGARSSEGNDVANFADIWQNMEGDNKEVFDFSKDGDRRRFYYQPGMSEKFKAAGYDNWPAVRDAKMSEEEFTSLCESFADQDDNEEGQNKPQESEKDSSKERKEKLKKQRLVFFNEHSRSVRALGETPKTVLAMSPDVYSGLQEAVEKLETYERYREKFSENGINDFQQVLAMKEDEYIPMTAKFLAKNNELMNKLLAPEHIGETMAVTGARTKEDLEAFSAGAIEKFYDRIVNADKREAAKQEEVKERRAFYHENRAVIKDLYPQYNVETLKQMDAKQWSNFTQFIRKHDLALKNEKALSPEGRKKFLEEHNVIISSVKNAPNVEALIAMSPVAYKKFCRTVLKAEDYARNIDALAARGYDYKKFNELTDDEWHATIKQIQDEKKAAGKTESKEGKYSKEARQKFLDENRELMKAAFWPEDDEGYLNLPDKDFEYITKRLARDKVYIENQDILNKYGYYPGQLSSMSDEEYYELVEGFKNLSEKKFGVDERKKFIFDHLAAINLGVAVFEDELKTILKASDEDFGFFVNRVNRLDAYIQSEYTGMLVEKGYKPEDLLEMTQAEYDALLDGFDKELADDGSKSKTSVKGNPTSASKMQMKKEDAPKVLPENRRLFLNKNTDLMRALGHNEKSLMDLSDEEYSALENVVKKAAEIDPNKVNIIPETGLESTTQSAVDEWNRCSEAERRLLLAGQFEGFGSSAPRRVMELMDLVGAGFVDKMPDEIRLPKENSDISERALGKFNSKEKIGDKEYITKVEFSPKEIEDLVAFSSKTVNSDMERFVDKVIRAKDIWNQASADDRNRFLSGAFDKSSESNTDLLEAYEALTSLSQIGDNIPLIGKPEDVLRASKLLLLDKQHENERDERINNFEAITDVNDLRDIQVSPDRLRKYIKDFNGKELTGWDLNEIFYAIGAYNKLPVEEAGRNIRSEVLNGTIKLDENDSNPARRPEYLMPQINLLREYGLIPPVPATAQNADAQPGMNVDNNPVQNLVEHQAA